MLPGRAPLPNSDLPSRRLRLTRRCVPCSVLCTLCAVLCAVHASGALHRYRHWIGRATCYRDARRCRRPTCPFDDCVARVAVLCKARSPGPSSPLADRRAALEPGPAACCRRHARCSSCSWTGRRLRLTRRCAPCSVLCALCSMSCALPTLPERSAGTVTGIGRPTRCRTARRCRRPTSPFHDCVPSFAALNVTFTFKIAPQSQSAPLSDACQTEVPKHRDPGRGRARRVFLGRPGFRCRGSA